MDEPLEHLYFSWLCAKVFHVEVPTPSLTYWELFKRLFNTEYVWTISGDDNRCEDGKELRGEFLIETGIQDDGSLDLMGCSIFEMLYALARRASFTTGDTSVFWFWRFLENLGLNEINDASDVPLEEIDRVLFDFVWRNYDEFGNGGLFPMNNPPNNQQQIEVWYQFHEYLVDQDWPI